MERATRPLQHKWINDICINLISNKNFANYSLASFSLFILCETIWLPILERYWHPPQCADHYHDFLGYQLHATILRVVCRQVSPIEVPVSIRSSRSNGKWKEGLFTLNIFSKDKESTCTGLTSWNNSSISSKNFSVDKFRAPFVMQVRQKQIVYIPLYHWRNEITTWQNCRQNQGTR